MGSLTKSAKIGIGVFVFLVVGGLIGLGVYFAVRPADNQGNIKFGSLTVRDKATNHEEQSYTPGETVELQYGGENAHKTAVDYQIRTSEKGAFVNIGTNQFGNVFNYVLPDDLFSTHVTFRVVDSAAPTDYVDSTVVQVTPVFQVSAGAGLQAGQAVYRIVGSSVVLELDANIRALTNVSDFAVDVSSSKDFEPREDAELLAYDAGAQSLAWRTQTSLSSVYYRVRTTSLVANGSPEELVSALPYPVEVKNPPTCQDTDPRVCSVRMTSTRGTEGVFKSNENVLIVVTYFTTLPAGLTFAESVDGTNFTPLSLSDPSIDNDTLSATYAHTLGDFNTMDFQVRVVDGPDATTSIRYSVSPVFSMTGPFSYPVVPAEAPQQITTRTVVTGPLDFTGYRGNWSVGYVDPGTGNPFMVRGVSDLAFSGNTATVFWSLDAENLQQQLGGGNVTVNLQLAFQLEGSSPTVQVVSPSPTEFQLKPFNPRAAPMFQFNTDQKTSVQGEIGNTLALNSTTTKDSYWFDGTSMVGNICLYRGTESPPYDFACWKIQPEPTGLDTLTVSAESPDEFSVGGPFSEFPLDQRDVPVCVNPSVGILVMASTTSACDLGFEPFVGQWGL